MWEQLTMGVVFFLLPEPTYVTTLSNCASEYGAAYPRQVRQQVTEKGHTHSLLSKHTCAL